MTTVYDFDCVALNGKPFPLSQFKGRPLLIVNTASLCGYSGQYKQIEMLSQKYKDQGLVVLGVPSNDFGRQEPGNNAEIASLCSAKFGVSFPFLEKTPVSGRHAHPLFKWLGEEGGFLSRPHWNFYKYIVGRDGHVKDWFITTTPPDSARVVQKIDNAVRN